jgi:hypothetical protein
MKLLYELLPFCVESCITYSTDRHSQIHPSQCYGAVHRTVHGGERTSLAAPKARCFARGERATRAGRAITKGPQEELLEGLS